MSRIFATAVVLLALVAAPAAAQTEPVPTPPCPTSDKYTTVGLAGKDEAVDPLFLPSAGSRDEPFASNSHANYLYRIDVSGSATNPFATKGNVTIDLSWEHDGDYDLYVYDSSDSAIATGQNGFVGVRPETATLIGLPHCTDIRVEIQNYLAPPSFDMHLKTTISGLKP